MSNFERERSTSYTPTERGDQYLLFGACFSFIGQTVLEI